MPEELERTESEMDAETTEATEPEIDYRAELEKTRKALRDANREAADRRKRLEAFEAEEAKRKEASMSELEKAQAQLSEWQQKAAEAERSRRDALVRAAVIAAFRHAFPGAAVVAACGAWLASRVPDIEL